MNFMFHKYLQDGNMRLFLCPCGMDILRYPIGSNNCDIWGIECNMLPSGNFGGGYCTQSYWGYFVFHIILRSLEVFEITLDRTGVYFLPRGYITFFTFLRWK